MSNLLRLSACLTILLSFNAFAVDTDGDGFSDADEAILGTDPNDPTSPLENKLTASDAASEDQFGYSVSIDGDTAVIGARLMMTMALPQVRPMCMCAVMACGVNKQS